MITFRSNSEIVEEVSEKALNDFLSGKNTDPNKIIEIPIKITTTRTLLEIAIKRGEKDAVKRLLEAGANPNLKAEENDSTALQKAIIKRNIEIFYLLLEYGSDIDANGNILCETALHATSQACSGKDNGTAIKMAKVLLARGADIRVLNKCEETPTDAAISSAHSEGRLSMVLFFLLQEYKMEIVENTIDKNIKRLLDRNLEYSSSGKKCYEMLFLLLLFKESFLQNIDRLSNLSEKAVCDLNNKYKSAYTDSFGNNVEEVDGVIDAINRVYRRKLERTATSSNCKNLFDKDILKTKLKEKGFTEEKAQEITGYLLTPIKEGQKIETELKYDLSDEEIKECKTVADAIFTRFIKSISEEELISKVENTNPSKELEDVKANQAIGGIQFPASDI